MIKKTVEYTDLIANDGDFEEVEKQETVRFIFTLPALKLYEQRTGNNFFDDYHKAFGFFSSVITTFSNVDMNNLTTEDQVALVPIMTEPVINNFILNLVPCLYTEVHEGKFFQNEETASNAEDSLWLMSIINISFLADVMEELSANQSKVPVKNGKKRIGK